jgi:hypothetical protein
LILFVQQLRHPDSGQPAATAFDNAIVQAQEWRLLSSVDNRQIAVRAAVTRRKLDGFPQGGFGRATPPF